MTLAQRIARRKAAARRAGRLFRQHAYKPARWASLVRAYRLFVEQVDRMHGATWQAPRTRAARHRVLDHDLAAWAYGALCEVVSPRTDAARAVLASMVPDLMFARVDRIAPAELLSEFDAAAFARWREASRLLAMEARHDLELTFGAAKEQCSARFKDEARLHRSLDTFLEGSHLLH